MDVLLVAKIPLKFRHPQNCHLGIVLCGTLKVFQHKSLNNGEVL